MYDLGADQSSPQITPSVSALLDEHERVNADFLNTVYLPLLMIFELIQRFIQVYPEGFFSQANALQCLSKSSDEDFFPQISPHPLFCRVSGLFLAQLMGTNVSTCSALKARPCLRRGPDPSATLPFTVRETDGADSRCVFEEAVLDLVQFVVPLTGWFAAQPLIEQ